MAIQFPLNPVDGDEFNAVGRRFRYTSPPGVWESIGSQDAESDPIFSASPAAGITSTEITSWNEAYSWGDHGVVGYELASNKGIPNGYASLDANGKVLTTQVPPLAITEVFVVADEAARLALTAQEGDVAIQTDTSTTYIKNSGTSGTNADWNVIEAPVTEVDPVFSASPAAGISSGQISNYDFVAGTVNTNYVNWNTAYGWGDHAQAGYLTSYTETDTLDSVTGRGNTTTNAIQTGNITADSATITAQNSGGTITLESASFTVPETSVSLAGSNPTIKMNPEISEDAVIENRRGGSDLLLKTSVTNNSPQTRMTINSSGNVGIGTTSPSQVASKKTLHVYDATNGGAVRIGDATTNMFIDCDTASGTRIRANAGDMIVGTNNAAGNLNLITGGSTKVTVLGSNGNVTFSGDIKIRQDTAIGLDLLGTVSAVPSAQNHGYIATGDSGAGGANGDLLIAPRTSALTSIRFITGTTPTERLTIASTGNVGIGTDGPNEKLSLRGSGSATSLYVYDGAGSTAGRFTSSGDIIDISARGSVNSKLTVTTGAGAGSTAMTIASNGNVGIGTQSPGALLDISSASNTILRLNNTGTNAWDIENDSNLKFSRGGTERMRIDSIGNVGIGGAPTGISSNATTLQLKGGVTTKAGGIRLASSNESEVAFFYKDSTNGLYIAAQTGNNQIRFLQGSTAAMTIDSSGNLLIGKQAPSAVTVGPQLLPTGVFNSGIAASTNSTITNTIYSTTAAATRFYVGMGGTIFATSTSITAISDASLKENVRDLDKGLESIKALKPRRYDWKNGDGTDVMGFIAQEVEEVMPELVYDYQYTAEETKKGLKMGDMLPSMVKAIQELAQQVEDLQAELAALKSTGEA